MPPSTSRPTSPDDGSHIGGSQRPSARHADRPTPARPTRPIDQVGQPDCLACSAGYSLAADPLAVGGVLWSSCDHVGMVETGSGGPAGPRLAGGRQAGFFPGYLPLVMATGIIAVGASQQNIRW